MVISLAAAFIASSAAANLLLQQPGQDIQTLRRILDNLAYFAALPLIASALLAYAWQQDWSKAGWGRWLLALFALFELCRRSGIGAGYSQILALLCVTITLISLCKFRSGQTRLFGTLSLLCLAPALLLFSPASLLQMSNPTLFGLSLGGALALLSLALGKTRIS